MAPLTDAPTFTSLDVSRLEEQQAYSSALNTTLYSFVAVVVVVWLAMAGVYLHKHASPIYWDESKKYLALSLGSLWQKKEEQKKKGRGRRKLRRYGEDYWPEDSEDRSRHSLNLSQSPGLVHSTATSPFAGFSGVLFSNGDNWDEVDLSSRSTDELNFSLGSIDPRGPGGI